MESQPGLVDHPKGYCLSKPGEIYALYFPTIANPTIDMRNTEGNFTVNRFNPLEGGDLQPGKVESIAGGGIRSLGQPQELSNSSDWVVLVKKATEEDK